MNYKPILFILFPLLVSIVSRGQNIAMADIRLYRNKKEIENKDVKAYLIRSDSLIAIHENIVPINIGHL
jgi:hypothetical protein